MTTSTAVDNWKIYMENFSKDMKDLEEQFSNLTAAASWTTKGANWNIKWVGDWDAILNMDLVDTVRLKSTTRRPFKRSKDKDGLTRD